MVVARSQTVLRWREIQAEHDLVAFEAEHADPSRFGEPHNAGRTGLEADLFDERAGGEEFVVGRRARPQLDVTSIPHEEDGRRGRLDAAEEPTEEFTVGGNHWVAAGGVGRTRTWSPSTHATDMDTPPRPIPKSACSAVMSLSS